MANISYFESRSGKVACNADAVFNFVTDIRNFEQFIPHGTINQWQAEKEFCSFDVSMIGTVRIKLAEKERNVKVVFTGEALKDNNFSLILKITDFGNNPAEVKIMLNAEINPILKMMVSSPIDQFLEKLISEMELFKGWETIK